MIVFIHVVIAVSSVGYSAYAFFSPSVQKLRISYALVGLTFATGFWLVVAEPAQLVSACKTGLAYLAVISVGLVATRNKLAAQAIR